MEIDCAQSTIIVARSATDRVDAILAQIPQFRSARDGPPDRGKRHSPTQPPVNEECQRAGILAKRRGLPAREGAIFQNRFQHRRGRTALLFPSIGPFQRLFYISGNRGARLTDKFDDLFDNAHILSFKIREENLLAPREHFMVFRVAAFKPGGFALPFKGEDVRCDAVEKPAVVRNHHHAAAKFLQTLFERAQRSNV